MELDWAGLSARVAATQQIPTRLRTGYTQLFGRNHGEIAAETRVEPTSRAEAAANRGFLGSVQIERLNFVIFST